jgi:hypothetical protein
VANIDPVMAHRSRLIDQPKTDLVLRDPYCPMA